MTTSSSSNLPIITFNSLYNIIREEERSIELHTIPNYFFEGVEEFLKAKENELKHSEENTKLKNKITSAKRMYSTLQKIRLKKIVMCVIDSIEIDDSLLGKTEKEFKNKFENIYHN